MRAPTDLAYRLIVEQIEDGQLTSNVWSMGYTQTIATRGVQSWAKVQTHHHTHRTNKYAGKLVRNVLCMSSRPEGAIWQDVI